MQNIIFNYEEKEFELEKKITCVPPEVESPAAYIAKIESNILKGTLKKAELFWSQNADLINKLRVAKWMGFVKQFIDIDYKNDYFGDHLFIQKPTEKVLEVFKNCIKKAEEIQEKKLANNNNNNPKANYVGSIGDRIEDVLTLTDTITKDNEDWTLTKFKNLDGCEFVTFGVIPEFCTKNKPVKLRFTVKNQKRFNGVKQNIINRLFVIEAPADNQN